MSTVKTKSHDTWFEIILHHPQNRNAISFELIDDLNVAVEQATNPAYRAVLIRGEGPAFCVGGDVKAFSELVARGEHIPVDAPNNLHRIMKGLQTLDKPVIAAVHGSCAGAGVSLMLACDLALAAEQTKFFMAYLTIGTSPDGGSTYFLPRHVGSKKAAELFFANKPFSVEEALEWGLINSIHPANELFDAAQQLAQRLAAGPTQAYAKLKQLLHATGGNTLEQQLALEAQLFSDSSKTEDFREGVTSFAEKRRPTFTGK